MYTYVVLMFSRCWYLRTKLPSFDTYVYDVLYVYITSQLLTIDVAVAGDYYYYIIIAPHYYACALQDLRLREGVL